MNSSVYPRPQWMREIDAKEFNFSDAVPCVATDGVIAEVRHFQRWMREDHGLDVAMESWQDERAGICVGLLSDGRIRSTMADRGYQADGREEVTEGYFLAVGSDHVILAGHDAAGVLHGLQLLRQLVVRSDDRLVIQPVEAHDWPYKSIRGIHLYMPPREQLQFFRRLLEFLSTLRYNTVFLEVGGGMRFDRHPEINQGWEEYVARIKALPGYVMEAEHGFPFPKNSTHYELAGGSFLEKDEVRQMLEWARALHIEVLPEVQSLSHAYYLCSAHPEIAENQADPFPDTYCPSNPASYDLLFDVMEEVIEVFEPRLIHTGHDELYILGVCPCCRGKDGADLLAGDLIKIHDFLAERGIQMALWGDKLMNIIVGGQPAGGREITVESGAWFKNTEPYMIPETFPAVERVPKDMLIFNWYWSTDSQSQQYFTRKGFEQIFGNLAFQGGRAFQRWDELASPPTVLGGEVSTWCEVSEYAFGHDVCLFNLAMGAQPLWWDGYCDNERGETLNTVANLQPRMRERLSGMRSPSLAAGAIFTCYPLPRSMAEQVTITGLPEGRTVMRGTPFDLSTAPGNVLRVDSGCPIAPAIVVNQCVDSLIFLHHCQCERRYFTTYGDRYIVLPTPEGVLGWYVMHYGDGSEERAEINYGENIANWHHRFGDDNASCCYWAEPAWEGCDETGRPVVLYRFEWVNPHPEREITGIELRSAGGQGEIRLAGVTGVAAV